MHCACQACQQTFNVIVQVHRTSSPQPPSSIAKQRVMSILIQQPGLRGTSMTIISLRNVGRCCRMNALSFLECSSIEATLPLHRIVSILGRKDGLSATIYLTTDTSERLPYSIRKRFPLRREPHDLGNWVQRVKYASTNKKQCNKYMEQTTAQVNVRVCIGVLG